MAGRVLALVTVALLAVGCTAQLGSPSPATPTGSPDGSPVASATPTGAVPATTAPTPPATTGPLGSSPPVASPGVARLCTPPPEGEVDPVDCSDAIDHALSALGPDAGRAAVAWYRHGIACPPNARCIAPPPGTGHVVVRFADGPVLLVSLQLTADGYANEPPTAPTWDVWGPIAAPDRPRDAPDLGPGAPEELASREPLPFCGTEDDIFHPDVRRCFLDAVRASAPAEFITAVPAADGALVRVVHRYTGSGPILVYRDRTSDPGVGEWSKEDCALDRVGDDQLVFIADHCEALALG